MKIRLEETDLFLADGRVDGHTDRLKERCDVANGLFPQFCERAKRNCVCLNVNSRILILDVEVHVFLIRKSI